MDTKIIKAGTLASLIAVAGFATTVTAQTTEDALDAQAAIAIALEEVPGEVQEVEREREDGATIFEVAVLSTAGERMEIAIDAASGDILEVAADEKDCDRDDDDEDDGEDEA